MDLRKFHYSLRDHTACMIQYLSVQSIANLPIYYADELLELLSIKNRSSITLKKFIDGAKNYFLALEKLDEPLWDIIILIILTRKLGSLGNWQGLAITRNPTFKDFHEFLEMQAICLEVFSE